MQISQPTRSEMHSKQPFHGLGKLRVNDVETRVDMQKL